ncbi:hypothetical protein [Nocardiopsis dassonvillei]|uniref:hypothetical protein n=1 Tax=Nocardiopsis dassonvillei TaxID=2014 RepID=UPI0012FE5868|nr:hypothetical protein [Nocardiopsis dassonvillei]
MAKYAPMITSAVAPEGTADDAYLFQGTWVAHYKRKNGKWEHTYAANEAQHVSRMWPQLAHTVGRKAHRAVFEHKEELWFFHNGSKKITLYNLRDKKVTTVDTAAKIVLPDAFKDKPITAAAKTSSDVVYLFSGSEYFAYRLSDDATLATGALDSPKPVDSGYRDPKTGKAYLCSGDKLVPVTAGDDHKLTPGTAASLAGTWPKPPLGRPQLVLYSTRKAGNVSRHVFATHTDIDASTEDTPKGTAKITVSSQDVGNNEQKSQWWTGKLLLAPDHRYLLCLTAAALVSIDVSRIGAEGYEPYAAVLPVKEPWSNADECEMAFSLDGTSLWIKGRPGRGEFQPFQCDVSSPGTPRITGPVKNQKDISSYLGVSAGRTKKYEYAYFGTHGDRGIMRVRKDDLKDVQFFRGGVEVRVLGHEGQGETLYLSSKEEENGKWSLRLESYETQSNEAELIKDYALDQPYLHFSSFLTNGERMCTLRSPGSGANYLCEFWRRGEKNPYSSFGIAVPSNWSSTEELGSILAMDPNGNFVYYLYEENNTSRIGILSFETGTHVARIDTGAQIYDRDLVLGWAWSS